MENGKRKWCSYGRTNGHLNKDCYQQQSESGNLENKKIWRIHHKESENHSDGDCCHQRNGSGNSTAGSKSTKYENFITDSTVTGCDKCSCKSKVTHKCTEIGDESNTPPDIGFSFTMCHLPLSQEADGFQLLVTSGSSKHFVGPELIRGIESRMLTYTRTDSPMKIRAVGNNVLRGTVQSILLVVVSSTDNVLETV